MDVDVDALDRLDDLALASLERLAQLTRRDHGLTGLMGHVDRPYKRPPTRRQSVSVHLRLRHGTTARALGLAVRGDDRVQPSGARRLDGGGERDRTRLAGWPRG